MTIFIPPQDIEKKKDIRLSADKAHYLASVLRYAKGDEITVIDGAGRAYRALIAAVSKKGVYIDMADEVPAAAESPLDLALCQGILKGEKMDLVIQKATELGAREIIPVVTERSVIRETRKVGRWRKIAEEAAEQCGRAVVPVIHEPVEIGAWIASHGPGEMGGLIFWEGGGLPLREAFQQISPQALIPAPFYLFIGPEGGFTPEEVRLAEDRGLVRTTLGRRLLRAETAAISAVAVVQYLSEFCYNNGK